MAIKTFELKVADVIRETEDAVSIAFDIPDDIKEEFKYKHGQFLTFLLRMNGGIERRAYSLSSSPYTDERLVVTVKRVAGGAVSSFLVDNLNPGDVVEVMPPKGKFTIELNPSNRRNYVMFGGGSGITPLMSIIKSILFIEKESSIILFYSNRNEGSIIFRDEIDKLLNQYGGRFRVINILSRPTNGWIGPIGRIDDINCRSLLEKYIKERIKSSEYFICGHPGMMKAVISILKEFDIPKAQIHKEIFTTTNEDGKVKDDKDNDNTGGDARIKERKVTITLYGETHEVIVQPDESVLLAAMREGYDPPFSCQIGACATCRAKLKSGKVTMDEREALTDEEIEEGYILTCQSHPVSDNVVIDYDDQ